MKKKSDSYSRAQAMILCDKYNLGKTEFFKELSSLAAKYVEYDAMTVETYEDNGLNIVVTITAKKVKPALRA
ncbi:MAG: hypothetical protein NC099_04925 [Corallococcus sp.]|nr:hypothetical protein [Corallococcus sp.]